MSGTIPGQSASPLPSVLVLERESDLEHLESDFSSVQELTIRLHLRAVIYWADQYSMKRHSNDPPFSYTLLFLRPIPLFTSLKNLHVEIAGISSSQQPYHHIQIAFKFLIEALIQSRKMLKIIEIHYNQLGYPPSGYTGTKAGRRSWYSEEDILMRVRESALWTINHFSMMPILYEVLKSTGQYQPWTTVLSQVTYQTFDNPAAEQRLLGLAKLVNDSTED